MRSTLIPIDNRWVAKIAADALHRRRIKPVAASTATFPTSAGRRWLALLAIVALASCERLPQILEPLPESGGAPSGAASRQRLRPNGSHRPARV